MVNTPESDRKRPLENGLNSINEESGTLPASEEEPCLSGNNLKNRSVESLNKKDVMLVVDMETLTVDGKPLSGVSGTNNTKSFKVKAGKKRNRFTHIKFSPPSTSVFEKRLQEKTGLSRLGLIVAGVVLLILALFILIVLLMGIFWPRIPHSQQFPICRRSACLQASSEVLPKMNTSVEPCEDFRAFSCSSWMTSNPMPKSRSEWGLDQKLQFDYRERTHQMITTFPHPTRTTSLHWKIKHWYESCMSLDNIEVDDARPLTKIVTLLGGWKVLRDFSVRSWDMKQTLERLHSQYGVHVFLQVSVVPNARDSQASVIKVHPAPLGLPDRSYYTQSVNSPEVDKYKRLLKDAVSQLGATTRDAGIFSDSIFSFEKRIVEMLPDKLTEDPLEDYNMVTIAELKNIAGSIPLHDILLAKFPRMPIDESTQVVVPSLEYLKSISHLISTTDLSALNNYMMWRLAVKYLPYLSEKFRSTYSLFRKDMYGEEEPIERWEFCVATLQKFMAFGLAALLQKTSKTFDREYKVVNEMFEEILRNVKRNVRGASNVNQDLRDHLLDKVNGLGLQFGFTEAMIRDKYLDDYYREFYVQKNDFFQNIRSGELFLQDLEKERLKTPLTENRWIDAMSFPGTSVRYIVTTNTVLVPVALVMRPYFHPEYPLAVLYGNLGVKLASAIVSSVAPWNILYAGDGTLLVPEHPAVEQARASMVAPFLCLQGWLVRNSNTGEPIRNQTIFDNLVAVSAVRQSYQALQNALLPYPHMHQPGLEYFESEAIFFITYAQSICVLKTPQQRALELKLGNKLEDSLVLNAVLAQSKEFTATFSCSATSRHYSEYPCEEIIKPNTTSQPGQFCVLKHCFS